ncbi:MAG: GAF domain-containing protein [Candidatus Obscuribacterales bacterium]|nr:GAF domain-containing protein [Candidatus Obscuribacterales bacterium]
MFKNENAEKFQSDEPTIQPNGYLMVLDREDLRVVKASANFSRIVVGGAKTILRHSFDDLFGAAITANLKRRINHEGRTLMLISGDFPLFDQRRFNCFVQTVDERILIEMEESQDNAEASTEQTMALTEAVAAFGRVGSIEELMELIPPEVKKLSGFDRVMVYKLDQAMTGQVISERVSPGMESFLNFSFPAQDITLETCEQYCRNTVRAVPDSHYEPAPLLGDSEYTDLSNCALASASKNHIEHLRKNGIGASLSISIVCNGRLWGLIVCHHRQPKPIHHWLRSYCEVVGKLISLRISAYEDGTERDLKEKLRRFFEMIRENPTREALETELIKNAPTILELFDGKGMAVISGGTISTFPVTPASVDISKYADWLIATNQKNVFIEDNLRSKFPLAGMIETASGVITMSFPAHHLSIHIFRPELTQTFTWASSIFMSVEKTRSNESPYEVLRQTIEKHSAPWTLNQMFMAQVFFESTKNALTAIEDTARA